jgi:cytochrome bd-type quinol oxidase subunit 1
MNILARTLALGIAAAVLTMGATALAQTPGGDPLLGGMPAYRTLFDPKGSMGWLNPRVIVWVFAQLHLLFAAFVLAVPMFVIIIELVGLMSSDAETSKKYDDLAHEFTRLLTTAFSLTSILGAVFTFLCLGLYPRIFNYLVEAFGPTMYLYACIFFGESFSLYFYYYGWGKMNRWAHLVLGLVLNVFGITLMFIANSWTTFTMAPGGVDDTGRVVSPYAAFWPMPSVGFRSFFYFIAALLVLFGLIRMARSRSARAGAGFAIAGAVTGVATVLLSRTPDGGNFLLHPINIHRLIANFCMGGSVAAAYAAYRFLNTNDPARRAHYDWMGYIGNFIAIVFLLPLPFAGYYLGFEIYNFNQQLGIYMMGGILSWLFVMQAVLIGALFFAANYYLWLGMDRIPGAERYRGWIKFLLGTITVCILVWATPKSLILTSAEIDRIGGTNHPILSPLGVMSAKNTAVNLLILTTFLSFLLYRRGNKVPAVSWAKAGTAVQALAFGVAIAVVVVIGVGGYIPALWMESTRRVAMSPYQVIAVLACMVVVMPIDVALLRGAREIGPIRWGQVSRRSQYTLFFLAASFTWLMSLMGFVRSSLRQHWHVYEVLKDESPWAYTPTIGYATVVVSAVVVLFFVLVAVVVWVANLGTKTVEEEPVVVPAARRPAWGVRGVAAAAVVILAVVAGRSFVGRAPPGGAEEAAAAPQAAPAYAVVDAQQGVYKIPVESAMRLLAAQPSYLEPAVEPGLDLDEMSPLERGEYLFLKSQYACGSCHSTDGSAKQAPTLLGRFGKPTRLSTGESVTFDEAYFRASVLQSQATFAEGFDPSKDPGVASMPVFEGQISEQELNDLVAYVSSL